jgi:hypothetical protein
MPPLAEAAAAAAAAIGPAMAASAPALSAISTVAGIGTSLIGAGVQAQGVEQQAANAEALGQYQQQQYVEQGNQAIAESQRGAEEVQRKEKLLQSTLIARGAGNGVDASMGSVNKLGQDIAGRAEYSSLMDLSRGQDLATGYTNQGSAAKYQGDLTASLAPQQESAAYIGAASSIFSTLGKFKYG